MPEQKITKKPWKDEELWNMVKDFYKSGIKYREGRDLSEMWDKFEQYYDNEYWNNRNRPAHLTKASDNLLFEAIETMLPVITSRPPRPEITPKPNNLDEASIAKANEYATKIQRECVSIWHKTRMMAKIRTGFREHGIKGTWMLRSLYDPEENTFQNTGCDLLSIIPNPTAFNMRDCYDSWFIYAPVMSVKEAYKKYGVWLEPESQDEAELGQHIGMLKKGVRGVQKVLNYAFGGDNSTQDKKRGFVVLIECWMADQEQEMETVDLEERDEDGVTILDEAGKKKTRPKERRKYPNGKVVTIARNTPGTILAEKPNSYGKRFPFFRTVNYERDGDFYGTSEGKNIEDQMLMNNQSISNINDNIRYTANPQKELVRGAKIRGVTDEPGALYEVDVAGSVRNIPVGQMPGYALDWPDRLQASSDRKVGMSDAMRGISSSGDSGIKTQALIAQATGRLQPKTAAFVEFSRQFYEHCVYVIKNYYPESVIQQDIDSAGEPTYEEFAAKEGRDLEMTVDVSQISMLPFDNYAEFEEAQAIYSIINPKTNMPAMSLEQLIDTAPALRDKQRVKAYNADLEEQMQIQQMIQEAVEGAESPEAAQEEIMKLMENNPDLAPKIAEMAGIQLPEPEQVEEEI